MHIKKQLHLILLVFSSKFLASKKKVAFWWAHKWLDDIVVLHLISVNFGVVQVDPQGHKLHLTKAALLLHRVERM